MSLDDTLRELMAERSSGRTLPAGHLDRLHGRLARRRTRRIRTTAVATAVACAALAGTAVAWPGHAPTDGPPTAAGGSATSTPMTSASTLPPLTLPERHRGYSLVEQKSQPLSPGHGEFTLVFVPRQWNFSITMACVTAAVPVDYQIEILINGSRRPHIVATCNENPTDPGLPLEPSTEDEQRRWWQHVHVMIGADTPVRLNEPMTITARVGTPQPVYDPRVEGEIIRSGPFSAAYGQAVVGVYRPG
jgi:hypothetical protein